jgi:NTE family protein
MRVLKTKTSVPKPAVPRQNVMVFQGGGALGAYQAGVFEALAERGIEPDWLVGTSIGAINAALIAGNRPKDRIERLRQFWQLVALERPFASLMPVSGKPWTPGTATWQAVTRGVPGFFQPRLPLQWDFSRRLPPGKLSVYDALPLRKTLLDLIDFDYLNKGDTRLSLFAVNLSSGLPARFDNRRDRNPLTPEHIMASGALPPGFAPVEIDGQWYWDGGIYSNTPLDIVLDDAQRCATLCFMVDLWDASEPIPETLGDAVMRMKNLQFSSRSHEHLRDHRIMQDLRRAVKRLGEHLPPELAQQPEFKRLLDLGCDHSFDVVHLVMKAQAAEDSFRDVDFSSEALRLRKALGLRDGKRAADYCARLPFAKDNGGLRVHTVDQDD